MKVTEIADTICPGIKHEIIGVRPGEKIHEEMISKEDAPYTYEYDSYYKILPAIYNWNLDPARIDGGNRVADNFSYSSDKNPDWMSSEELDRWVKSNKDDIGKI